MQTIRVYVLLALLAGMLTGVETAAAQTVRGKLYQEGPDGVRRPAAFVNVVLKTNDLKPASYPVATGVDGMYYFRNIMPGTYILEIQRGGTKPLLRYSIQVLPKKVTNIKPIVLPASGPAPHVP